jgi:UDP:flavonoid glycosyltransferase YjiC (YdhE family)
MRVFIVALGTRGDIEPFVLLADELLARGHEVTLGTSAFYFHDRPGLRWLRIGEGDLAQLREVLAGMAALPLGPARVQHYLNAWLLPQFTQAGEAIVSQSYSCDYFICNLKKTITRPDGTCPGAFVTYDPPGDLRELARFGSHLHGGRTLELVAMERALIDPQRRWDARFRFTGFWKPARPAAQDGELARWLDAGAAPLVLTLGSMSGFDAPALALAFRTALATHGMRGVLIRGWSEHGAPTTHSAELIELDQADYGALFARAAGILHHGGAGTVAAVTAAGVPSIVLPQLPSQALWAQMLAAQSLSAGTIDLQALPTEAWGGALGAMAGRLLGEPRYRRAARSMGDRLAAAAPQGQARAALLIEQHARTCRVAGAEPARA